VSKPVRFEDEADAEYRAAGRWYEERRAGLGLECFDAIDVTLRQIVRLPQAGTPVPRVHPELQVRRAPVARFPYHVVYLETPAEIRVLAGAHDRRRPA
jgi:plasmid stabilization system protein ParE